eukprot:46960-Rhodomonas_salina.1
MDSERVHLIARKMQQQGLKCLGCLELRVSSSWFDCCAENGEGKRNPWYPSGTLCSHAACEDAHCSELSFLRVSALDPFFLQLNPFLLWHCGSLFLHEWMVCETVIPARFFQCRSSDGVSR